MDGLTITMSIVTPILIAFAGYITMYFNRLRENEETLIEEENIRQDHIRQEQIKNH